MPLAESLRRSALVTLLLVGAAFSPLVVGQAPKTPTAADVVTKVRTQFAPDTRVAVFDVKAEVKNTSIELTGDVEEPAAKDALLKALREAGFPSVIDRIAVLPDPAVAVKPMGVVTVSVAVMKTKASHPSELANQLIMGHVVKVLKKEGGWYYVQSLDDHYLGWMEPDHLALMTKDQAESFSRSPRVIVTALFALVREQASPDAAAVADLVVGNVLGATGQDGAWLAVQLPDGRKGFVSQADATDYRAWRAARAITPDNIEQTARRFTGVPYLWGGTSARGFDCSGFVKTVFRLNGTELQRDTDQQANEGVAVPTDNDLAQLRKGDVLFFGPRAGVTRITHTGIYLGGKLFIHCSGMVKVNSFDPSSPIYSENLLKRLVKVRRMESLTTD
ncbi:MAG TPA: NlpC/P60 family protein [Vicinamibacterales bacterium]